MMIFILASGYLFTVYMLLALAKRTSQNTAFTNVPASANKKHKPEISVRTKISEAVNSQ